MRLVAVKGINWVTANAAEPAVANMSLGGASSSIDNAVANSISSGITYAVAAGNSGANACNYSPARVGAALTVGATSQHRRDGVLVQQRLVSGHLRPGCEQPVGVA